MSQQGKLPQDTGPDNTVAFLNEGYLFITNRREKFKHDIFETHLLGGKKVICMAGKEAAKIFYDNDKFKREGAAPNRILDTLFGQDGVQTLDGTAHKHRKAMFMNFMNQDALEEIATLVEKYWMKFLAEWETKDSIIFYDEVKKVLTAAACEWVGLPSHHFNVKKLSEQLSDMYEAAEKVGMKHYKGDKARQKVETWLEELIEGVREENEVAPEQTPFYEIATDLDEEGNLLSKHAAAVEVLNLLRPITAISVYIALSVLALHRYKKETNKLLSGDKQDYKMFVQEIRRFYPFFPVAPAIVKENFVWDDYEFEQGTLVLLDLYGNNHHPDLWEEPETFNPARFEQWDGSPFDFIPQGGGDYMTGHRCAGEWLTIEVLQRCLHILINKMDYTLPEQNFKLRMNRMPSIPKSKIIMKYVQSRE